MSTKKLLIIITGVAVLAVVTGVFAVSIITSLRVEGQLLNARDRRQALIRLGEKARKHKNELILELDFYRNRGSLMQTAIPSDNDEYGLNFDDKNLIDWAESKGLKATFKPAGSAEPLPGFPVLKRSYDLAIFGPKARIDKVLKSTNWRRLMDVKNLHFSEKGLEGRVLIFELHRTFDFSTFLGIPQKVPPIPKIPPLSIWPMKGKLKALIKECEECDTRLETLRHSLSRAYDLQAAKKQLLQEKHILDALVKRVRPGWTKLMGGVPIWYDKEIWDYKTHLIEWDKVIEGKKSRYDDLLD